MKLDIRPVLALDVAASIAVMQAVAHAQVDAPLIGFDVAIAHAIYGRDRLYDQVPQVSDDNLVDGVTKTTALAVLPSVWYVTTHDQGLLAPLIVLLHCAYPQIKKSLVRQRLSPSVDSGRTF